MFLINPYRFGAPAAWSPASLFAAGELGAWYESSDFSSMFQDAAGTVPVTGVEQPVGRLLDKRAQAPSGFYSTLLDTAASLSAPVNAAFDLGSGDWTIELWVQFVLSTTGERGLVSRYGAQDTGTGGFSLRLSNANSPAGLRLVCSIPGSDAILQAAWSPSVLTWYHIAAVRQSNTLRLYVDGVQIGSTSISIAVGSPPSAPFVVGEAQTVPNSSLFGYASNVRLVKGTCLYANGSTFTPPTSPLTAVSGTSILTCHDRSLRDGSANNFTITGTNNARQTSRNPFNPATPGVIFNDLSQSNAASRPVLRARYNQLVNTEQFTTSWTRQGMVTTGVNNVGVAPDGTSTAYWVRPTAANTDHSMYQTGSRTTENWRFTIYVKAQPGSAYNWARVSIWSGTAYTARAFFNVTDGSLGTVASGSAVSVVDAGNGWWRVGVIGAMSTNASCEANIACMATDGGAAAFLGDGTSGIYIWGAQLQQDLLAQRDDTYQRVTTATDYNTVGFEPYIDFDGTDDCLFSASAVDLTATDQMTAHAGITRISNFSSSILAETSADAVNTNGAWHLLAPPTTANAYSFRARGTSTTASVTPSSYPAPSTVVLTGTADISDDYNEIRVNGTSQNTNANNLGAGNFGNLQLFVGARNNASNRLRMRLYSLIVRNQLSTAQEITDAETYINARTKAY